MLEYTAPPLGSPPDDVETHLEVKGTGWVAGTCVVAHLRGLHLGIPIVPVHGDHYEIIVDRASRTQKILLDVPLKFTNLNKKGFTGSLVPESLPSGVTLIGEPIPVKLAADSVKTAVAHLSIDSKKVQMMSSQMVTLTYNLPGGTSETSISFEALPSMRQWTCEWPGAWGTLDAFLMVADTNANSFDTELFSSLDAEIGDYEAKVWLGGMEWFCSPAFDGLVQNLFLGINAGKWTDMVKQKATFQLYMTGSW